MSLIDLILEANPLITRDDFLPSGKIQLRDDGDGIQYIAKWDYDKPIPKGLSLGKPNA
jgi:hypothetical protein